MERLERAYSADPYYRRIWDRDAPASRWMRQRKWDVIRTVLERESVDLRRMWLLDLGVGSGEDCARFLDLGLDPARLVGLDLVWSAVREARDSHPWMASLAGNAGALPFPSGRFGLVYQSTMLSSVLSGSLRLRILSEIGRVLEGGGVFLSYDTRYPNPWNPHTRPLTLRELRSSLPQWALRASSVTAIPQLQRAVAPLTLAGCRLLESVPFLRSHLVVLGRKPAV